VTPQQPAAAIRHAVLLKRPEQFQPAELARALAAIRKVPFQDALLRAKSCWGIVEERMGEEAARDLAARLEEAGLGAAAVPEDRIAVLPPTRLAAKEDFESAPWARAGLLAAAGFCKTESRTVTVREGPGLAQKAASLGIMMATGLPIRIGPKQSEVHRTVESSDLVFYLDLAFRGPEQRLRIDAQDFDYSLLGERMAYGTMTNFRQLVADAAARSPQALRSRGARTILEGRPLREMGYESLADLERESRWLLTLQALSLA